MINTFIQINNDVYHYRKERCSDCGFTPGTAANTSGVTAIKAVLCAEVPTPFLCHANAVDGEIPDGKAMVCQGWVEACNILNLAGHYEKQPEWLRAWKIILIDIIQDIEKEAPADPVEFFKRRMREEMAKTNMEEAGISPDDILVNDNSK